MLDTGELKQYSLTGAWEGYRLYHVSMDPENLGTHSHPRET